MNPTGDTTSPAAPATQSLIAGLLRDYMDLKTEQVVVYNQKWKVPPDDGLYLTVSSLGPQKTYGTSANTRLSDDGQDLLEDVSIAGQEMIALDLYSRSQEAVNRKEEPVLCLNSIAAQQLCEKWSLKLARIPLTMVDASALEGAGQLNRFHLAFAVLRTRTKTTIVESFDKFTQPTLALNP